MLEAYVERLLANALAGHEALREVLRAEFPDIDDETLRDTLEGISSVPELVLAVVRSYLEDVVFLAALRGRLTEIQARFARIETRAERKRKLIALAMERADLKKLCAPDFTVSLRSTPAPLVIIDEADVPEQFWKPQQPKLDRKGLLQALSSGQTVSGAMLGNAGFTIAVRTS